MTSNILRSNIIPSLAWCAMAADKPGETGKVKNVYQPNPDVAPVTKKTEAIAAYTAMLEELDLVDDDGDTLINGEQIFAIVRAVPGQGVEVEALRTNALSEACAKVQGDSEGTENTPHEDLSQPTEGEEKKVFADMSAADIGKQMNAETQADIREGVDGKEKDRRAPLKVRRDLLRQYGAAVVRAWPRPGTPNKATGDTGGNNPDRYDEGYSLDGEHKTRKVSTYDKMWSATVEGAIQLTERDNWKDALAKEPKGPYADERPDTKLANKNKWNARFSLSTRCLKQAIKIEHLIAAIEQHTPNVVVDIKRKRDADGKLTDEPVNTTKPIVLANKDDLGSAEAFSVGSFTQLKPAKCGDKKAGGTVAALKATAKRGAKGTTPETAKIPDMKTAEQWSSMLGHAFASAAFNDLFRKRMYTEGDEVDVQIKTWGDLFTELSPYFAPAIRHGGEVVQQRGEVRLRYDQVCERINEVQRKEREAKAQAITEKHNSEVSNKKVA